MKFFYKSLGLLLASVALASCGGGGGDGHAAFVGPQSGSITLSASTTTLPLNTAGYDPAQHGNPTQAEVTITWRNADGTLVTGHDLSVSISPVTVAAISCLTQQGGGSGGNTCADNSTLYGEVTLPGVNGQATMFVNSELTAGTATLVVSGVDPNTNATVSASLVFTVTSGVGSTPANIALAAAPTGVYLPGSGGNQSSLISATVTDGGGQLVPDPASGNGGFDNVQFDLVGETGGATLSATSASGPATGTSVSAHTVHGVATVSFQSGTLQGPIQVRATADRADNNVTNGITDPVTTTISVVVSDGKLFALQITSPDTNAILINTVSGDVSTTADTIPPDPDATYSLTVSALGTDRQGNPVLPGTPVRFGSIDEPAGTFDAGAFANQFLISGGDGNPQEGGTLFTAPSGQFESAGGGAGPGDAIVVFGKTQHGAPAGNEDLESALTVGHVNSQTSLNTTSPFNANDITGVSVDNGAVLPYIIGRSNHGNITANATTNDIGVAHATLNYTASTLGHIVSMWAQGDGTDTVTGNPRRVTDATLLLYPGVAPASLTAFPTPIPGNTVVPVTVCLVDALASPIQGVPIAFQLALVGGTGNVDGNGLSGTLDNLTGPDGCAVATVTTSGVPPAPSGTPAGTLTFAVGDATAEVDIEVALAFLQASPSQVCPGGRVNVTAISTTGAPASGVQISTSCSASPASGTTSASGVVSFTINTDAPEGTCAFTADAFGQSVSITVGGVDTSPPCGPPSG